jgi:ribosomal protein S18 acetylase RimI-like enzyme
MELVKFTDKHVDEAAELLAARHREDMQQSPYLPAKFAETEWAAKAICAILGQGATEGVAAIENGKMQGYMLGTQIEKDHLGGKAGWIYLPSHAALDQQLYRQMYAVIGDKWVRNDVFYHFAHVTAGDRELQELWFDMAFGREQAHGAMNFSEATIKNVPQGDIVIRESTDDDEEIFRQMATWITRFQTGTPIFAPVDQKFLTEQTQSYVEFTHDKDKRMFLAFRGDKLVAYQAYRPTEDDDADMMCLREAQDILGATAPDERGTGIGRILTEYAIKQMQAAGHEVTTCDWRCANPLSSRFWTGMGYKPTHYRLVRRMDARIGGIYKDLWS